MRVSPALAMLWLLPLGGCALFHSNIKGGFACTAPHGTCAPSTTIDDDAIRTIGAGSSADDSGTPTPPDAAAESTEVSKSVLKSGAGKSWTFVGPAHPALKVLYSAWRDGTGHLHPRTAAYVPVNAPRLAAADGMALDASQLDNPRDTSLLTIAEMAPDTDLDIDLIDRVNPFSATYAVLAKAMDEKTLLQVQAVINAKKDKLTYEDARALTERALEFKRERGRLPSLTSQDAWERKMAEGVAFLQRHATKAATNG